METELVKGVASEYPIYLRWSQLVELHGRLGLGSKKLVRRAVENGRIERVVIHGTRAHYTRTSVERLVEH